MRLAYSQRPTPAGSAPYFPLKYSTLERDAIQSVSRVAGIYDRGSRRASTGLEHTTLPRVLPATVVVLLGLRLIYGTEHVWHL